MSATSVSGLAFRPALCVVPRSAYVYTHRITPWWMAWEAAVVGLMWAALAVYFAYAGQLSAHSTELALGFDAYDALASAPARFFLTTRQNGTITVPVLQNLTASSAASSSSSLTSAADQFNNSTDGTGIDEDAMAAALAQLSVAVANVSTKLVSPAPGEPLRWQLPELRSGLQGAAGMMVLLQRLYTLQVTYYTLQGFVLVFLIVRWLHYITFQPRLSIISGTLALALKVRYWCKHRRAMLDSAIVHATLCPP